MTLTTGALAQDSDPPQLRTFLHCYLVVFNNGAIGEKEVLLVSSKHHIEAFVAIVHLLRQEMV